jgi:VWFA-related protein
MTVKRGLLLPVFIGMGLLSLAIPVRVSGNDAEDRRVSIEPRSKEASLPDIRVDSNLVLIPVSVTDLRNHPVIGLGAGNFGRLRRQSGANRLSVSSDDAPISVGIVFDASGSMAGKLPQAREAVAAFLKNAGPEDEFFLVNFNSKVELAVPFTPSAREIQNHLRFTNSAGKTALLDAVYQALNYMKAARNCASAARDSDGGDNDSRYNESEIRRLVRETEVWIYAIAPRRRTGDPARGRARRTELLADLAAETADATSQSGTLKSYRAPRQTGLELRNQYLLSIARHRGSLRQYKVKVQLVESGAALLSFRPGYYAPVR